MKEYIGIITIYKNVFIEAKNDEEAWKKLEEAKRQEENLLEDTYNVSKINLTK